MKENKFIECQIFDPYNFKDSEIKIINSSINVEEISHVYYCRYGSVFLKTGIQIWFSSNNQVISNNCGIFDVIFSSLNQPKIYKLNGMNCIVNLNKVIYTTKYSNDNIIINFLDYCIDVVEIK